MRHRVVCYVSMEICQPGPSRQHNLALAYSWLWMLRHRSLDFFTCIQIVCFWTYRNGTWPPRPWAPPGRNFLGFCYFFVRTVKCKLSVRILILKSRGTCFGPYPKSATAWELWWLRGSLKKLSCGLRSRFRLFLRKFSKFRHRCLASLCWWCANSLIAGKLGDTKADHEFEWLSTLSSEKSVPRPNCLLS